MKIQLVVPALVGFKYTRKSGCPPLGLASIATYLKRKGEEEIEIWDGELVGDNESIIDQLVPGSIVGILTKTPNYPGALEIAARAKEIGCTMVMGGVYATHMAETILERRKTVDFVVRGFGERSFDHIINMARSGRPFPKNRVISGADPVFEEIGWPERDWFDMDQYIKNFATDRPSWNISRGTNIFTHMGCVHKCDFCSRMGPLNGGVFWRNPINIWGEIRELAVRYGVDYVIDFSDAIAQNQSWLRTIIEARPADLEHIRWQVFATAESIPSSLELLKRLNVVHVFIGIESGDQVVAQKVRKGRRFCPSLVYRAIEKIVQAGIRVTPSFVYGLRGETVWSMVKTLGFAKEIISIASAEEVFASEMIPWPGSPAWNDVRPFFKSDILDISELKNVWLREIVGLDPKLVQEYVDSTLALAKYPISIRKGNKT